MSAFVDVVHRVLVASHVVSSGIWFGAVFMGSVVDWPAARESVEATRFPFDFIVGQGVRVFPWVYMGMAIVLATGIGLVWMRPPSTPREYVLLSMKALALLWMMGSTIYGTLRTWPKLQFATHAEATALYRTYIRRAYVTFGCGVLGAMLGAALGR